MDAKDVFLPPNGSWRQSWTMDATVRVHTSFRDYCRRLQSVFARATREIFLVGMEFAIDLRLDDPSKKEGNTKSPDFALTLAGTLQAAVQRGVRVRMLWSAPTSKESEWRTPAAAAARALGINSVVDEQMKDRPHHQKAVFVDALGESILFVGGMDLSTDRYQWFDVMAEIVGKGARLGLRTLEERWKSAVDHEAMGKFGWSPSGEVPQPSPDQTLLQFVRLYGVGRWDFVGRMYPDELSYQWLLLRAIDKAEKFIYMEEQFFDRVPALDDALVNAVNKQNGPTVVVIGARVNENERGTREVGSLRSRAKNKNRFIFLKWRARGGHVPNLIHSKTWVFDDQFAIIGSANYWTGSFAPRGNRIDSELGVGMMAPVVGSLRLTLWNRLLASWGGAPTIPSSATGFFDQLAVLMDRTVSEIQTSTGSVLTPGLGSPFEVMPDFDRA